MTPRTRSFDSARPRVLAGEGSSAAPLDSFAIAKKVLSRGELHASKWCRRTKDDRLKEKEKEKEKEGI